MKGVESFLKKSGFVKMPWSKCPQGFEKANYRCYSNSEKNIWVELYLSDKPAYGWVISPELIGNSPVGGRTFDTVDDLKKNINPLILKKSKTL